MFLTPRVDNRRLEGNGPRPLCFSRHLRPGECGAKIKAGIDMDTQGQARVRRIRSSSPFGALAISALVWGLSACGGKSSGNNNPVPTISSLSPDHATAGGSNFNLTVNGSNFISSSVVNWNNSAKQTTFVNSGQLTASISAGDIAAVGNVQVSVFNPAPGGGTSSSLTFSITGAVPITVLNLSTVDLVYDAVNPNHWIYASVPANAAPGSGSANTITAIDPLAGQVLQTPSPVSVPNNGDPSRLALSDNGQFLYFGLNQAPSVRRLRNLSSGTPELDPLIISLGSDTLRVETLQVLQGTPNSIAVARKLSNPSPGTPRNAGVAAFDADTGMRSTTTDAEVSPNVIQLCTTPSVLFGLNVGDGVPTAHGFYMLNVDASGVSVASASSSLSGNDISLGVTPIGGERIFSTSGQVLDPSSLTIVHTFPVTGLVKADTALVRVFYLTQNPPPSNTTWTIRAFNIDSFAPTGTMDIPGVNGNPGSLIRWGTNGLAFRTDSNQVFLITSSLVAGP